MKKTVFIPRFRMKRIALLLFLCYQFQSSTAQVDVGIKALALIVNGELGAFNEVYLTENIGLETSFMVRLGADGFFSDKESRTTGIQALISGRYYFNSFTFFADEDLYFIGLYSRYIDRTTTEEIEPFREYQRDRLAAGVMTGYKFIMRDKFFAEFSIGAGRNLFINESGDEDFMLFRPSQLDIFINASFSYRFQTLRNKKSSN